MPSLHSIDSDFLDGLRSGGFAGELRFAIHPNNVVWQATVNQTITDSAFVSFAWDGALQGVRANVVPGMTFLITATSDPAERRRPLLRGLVSQAPSGTTFYCGEAGINLVDGTILTVISNFEVVQLDRVGNLVNGYLAYQNLSPIVKDMQSFYYGESATSFQFSFAPVGQPMADGATIVSYAWTMPSGTVYNSGSASTRLITVTVPYGYHWVYLVVTDSNGVALRFTFEILVCLRDDPAFMYSAHDDVSIDGGVEIDWNVTTTFFAGVTDLLNRTRCAIVAFDLPKEGDGALWNGVALVGYIVAEETDVTADAVSSTLSQTRFEMQSFSAIAGQLPVPSLGIRSKTTPAAWEEMTWPTTQRVIGHLLTRYSTLATLCAIDMLYTDSTWLSDELDLEEGTLLDSINTIGAEIQARLVFFPQGDATLEINANYLDDDARNALPTLITGGNIEPQDVFGYSLPIPYYKTVGQVIAGCATFYADGSTPIKLRAIAPATSRQEGNERPVVNAQLLPANLTPTEATTAAKQRVGDLLEYLNPPTSLPTTFKDGWRILTPSTRVWLTYDLPAADSTRGLPIVPAERYLLTSVSLTWHVANGTWDVKGVSRLETRGGLAQTKATISPNTVNTDVPALPGLPDYDAFNPDASLNYASIDPGDLDLQPYSPNDLSQFTPMTTADAAAAADNMPGSTCQIISPPVSFRSLATRTTTVPTVNGQRYTVYAKGRGRVGDDFALTSFGPPWDTQLNQFEGREGAAYVYKIGVIWTGFQWTYLAGGNFPFYLVSYQTLTGTVDTYEGAWGFSPTPPNNVATSTIAMYSPGAFVPTNTTTARIKVVPVTSATRIGDAFYEEIAPGDWQPYTGTRGLLVNGTPVAVPPPHNDNSEYEFEVIGDGNVIPFTFYNTARTADANQILYLKVCGPGMGS